MNRFAVLAASTACLAIGAGAAGAQNLTPFRFGTNWLPQAEHGGYYQSMVDGAYAACGLDVTIVPGGPQVNGRALMLAGKLDAYMGGNLLFAFNGLVEDIPFKVVAATFQKEPQVIMTHPGVAKKFTDLKNLTLLIGDNAYQTFYQWMIAAFGFTPEQRRPYTFNSAPFLADKNTGQQGYVTSEPYAIQKEAGFKPDLWLLADEGFDTYATTIEVAQATIDTRRDDVQCFVDASAIGWYVFLYGDNAAAIAAIQEANPDMTDDKIAYAIETMKAFGIVDSGEALEVGIGAMTDARVKSFYDKMVESRVIAADLPIKESYTLDFVNKGVGLDLKAKLLAK
jgi:NitT/TauT family transport system substrate-binding protein